MINKLSFDELKMLTTKHLELCHAISCCLRGGADINRLDYLIDKLLEQGEDLDNYVLLLQHLNKINSKSKSPTLNSASKMQSIQSWRHSGSNPERAI